LARFLLVCAGGAAGTAARYLLSSWLERFSGASFPWGTLVVNLLGSFLLGVVMEVALTTDLVSPTLRITLATGLLGGFTTYSSFNYETLRLLQTANPTLAALNITFTLAGCLTAGALGLWTGQALIRA
jgi:CrcB protein